MVFEVVVEAGRKNLGREPLHNEKGEEGVDRDVGLSRTNEQGSTK